MSGHRDSSATGEASGPTAAQLAQLERLEADLARAVGVLMSGRLPGATEAGMRKTGSMRRAKRWLAESRAGAAAAGQTLDATTVAWFEHMMTCPDCELREDSDPRLCEVADAILDGTNDDLAWMSAEARP